MGRLTKRSNKTSHENGVCCTHFMSKECVQFGGECAWGCKWEEAAWGKLADYEEAEEQGLLLRLPCKIGSMVYEIKKDLNQMKRETIEHNGHYYHRNIDVYFVTQVTFEIEDIVSLGKTVFLTKEEAETALARMEGENE